MVISESHNMLGHSPNQYIHPDDYLSPSAVMLDSKKSPLALLTHLTQTCSAVQDPPLKSTPNTNTSPVSSASDRLKSAGGHKRKSSMSSDSGHGTSLKSLSPCGDTSESRSRPGSSGSTISCTSTAGKRPKLMMSPSDGNINNGTVSPKEQYPSEYKSKIESTSKKLRKLSGESVQVSPSQTLEKRRAPPTKEVEIVSMGKHSSESGGSESPHEKSSLESPKQNSISSPKICHDKDATPIIRSGFGAYPQFPPGFDPMQMHPAFRLPFLAAQHAHLMDYGRNGMQMTKPVDAAICRDPYCTGCQFKTPSGIVPNSLNGSRSPACPAGCAACDHQRLRLPLIPPPSSTANGHYPGFPGYPPSLLSHPQVAALAMMQHQHAMALAAQAQQQKNPFLHGPSPPPPIPSPASLYSSALLNSTKPPAPLGPSHPSLPTALALGGYYSPYPLSGFRIA